MATSYTTDPLTDDHGLPLINVTVQAYNTSTDALVETAYTGTAGTAAFTALPDDVDYYFIARWGNKTLRWTRDFSLPPKEYFQPATCAWDNSASAWIACKGWYDYAIADASAVDDKCYTTLKVPTDFRSLITAKIWLTPKLTKADAEWDVYVSYAGVGESGDTTYDSDVASTYSTTTGNIITIDITSLLGSLAADDLLGVKIINKDDGYGPYMLGVHLRYR